MKSLPAIIAATVAAATVAAVISLPAGADDNKKDGSPVPAPPELVACLHDHGLDAPATEISDFKGWVIKQLDTDAGKAALSACGLNTHPDEKVGDGPPKDKESGATGPCADAKRAAISQARKQQAAKSARRIVPAGT
ncbi:MAG TPA: hypothetical protein VI300_24225 [Solirubrobacter sp.]